MKKLTLVLTSIGIALALMSVACGAAQRYPTCINDRECKTGQKCVEQLCIAPPQSEAR